MDKYTVDLDQVLNDFEYSELTDQHSKNVPETPQLRIPFQPPPVIKHSINNVFHSLNEYVNSEINSGSNGGQDSTTCKPMDLPMDAADNKVKHNFDYNNSAVDTSSQNKYPEVSGRAETLKFCEHNQDIMKDSMELDGTMKYISELSKEVNYDVNLKENSLRDFDKNGTGECKYANNAKNLVTHVNNVQDNSLPSANNVDLPKTDPRDFCLLDTGKISKDSNISPQTPTEYINEELVNYESECDRDVNSKSDSLSQNDHNSLNDDDLEPLIGITDQSPKDDVADELYCDNLTENLDNNGSELQQKEDILIDISEFSADSLHADTDIETNKLIDTLSGDLTQSVLIEEKPEKIMVKDISEGIVSEIGMRNEEQSIKKDDNNPDRESADGTDTILKGQDLDSDTHLISRDKLNDNEVSNDKSQNATILPLQDGCGEHDSLEVVSKKVISFSADIEIDENELNKMLEEMELETNEILELGVDLIEAEGAETALVNTDRETLNEAHISENVESGKSDLESNDILPVADVEEEETPERPQIVECLEVEKPRKKDKPLQGLSVQVEREEAPEILSDVVGNESLYHEPPEESLSRPQDLPLNNQLRDEPGGRKINLIGSPGSTPYNNVYINKTIDSKSTHDNESDYTSSASPTFSDCSTGSTGTASTASVEELANNTAKVIRKVTDGLKNTNLEVEDNEEATVDVENTEEKESSIQGSIDSDEITEQTVTQQATLNEAQEATSSENITECQTRQPSRQSSESFLDKSWLGKQAPLWIPDADASACLHCDMKFTVIKRRHHCRACGLVLCSKCCNQRFRLEYLDAETRVCSKCYDILSKSTANNAGSDNPSSDSSSSPAFRPNPNNPLEYCSTVSPLQQAVQAGALPPSVMVPVGVLKRTGSSKKSNKSVMFCDGIAPGSDLTILDQDFNYNPETKTNKSPVKQKEEVKETVQPVQPTVVTPAAKISKNLPKIDEDTGCFIPKSETSLPPTITINKIDTLYSDCSNSPGVVEMLKNETLTFALTQNLLVHVKIINMSCCINKQAWCFSSEGLINVGCDEVVYLIEYIDEESYVPKDVFSHVYHIYADAVKGTSIKELGISLHNTANFLDSKNHAGFVYIKPTFQCLENVILPQEPYLIGILIHRWETPWAKLFPLRLILRLGAEYRYYPSPLISTRHRDSVYVEIGHTIINLLADFRNFTYTLPQIRGLIIHMEDKKTTITIPRNRYDLIMKSISNSSEHILAFAGNFSQEADSHLVCIQDTQGHDNCYTTHAINIHNKPRKVTGASFIVFNGSLKSSSGLTAKSNIVEDGLMIQIPSEHMDKIRDDLRNMKDHTISCGCINADSDETVIIVWGENDAYFNVGVKSPIDLADMKGVPSIRVHNGQDYVANGGVRLVRWSEVFILQNVEDNPRNQDPVDISKVSESIAKACCTALVKYLDLLISNGCQKVGIRATLHVDQVSYLAGSNGSKLAPIYMRSLDNELIPILHRITSNNLGDNSIVLELIFRILNA